MENCIHGYQHITGYHWLPEDNCISMVTRGYYDILLVTRDDPWLPERTQGYQRDHFMNNGL